MAVSTLVRLSEDKIIRQAYQRRQDEIMLQNRKDRRLTELESEIERLKGVDSENERLHREVLDKEAIISENEQLRQRLAELRSQLGEN